MFRTRSTPLPTETREVYLRQRPRAEITDKTFAMRTSKLPTEVDRNKVMVRVEHVSCDPAMRGWLRTRASYIKPIEVGEVMRAMGVGKILDGGAGFRVGETVCGPFGWRQIAVVDAAVVNRVVVPRGVRATAALGVLGTTGLTAYFGLLEVGKVRKGETVVVSAAAGATGSVVAQIAKNVMRCSVIGIAGGLEKCEYLRKELGIEAIDYKSEEGVDEGLKRVLNGSGIDVYFDNVGGATLETTLKHIGIGARVVLCGAISMYNKTTLQAGPSTYANLITQRGSMTGFIVLDYEKRYAGARQQISKWMSAGKIKVKEHEVVGLENAPLGLKSLFEGRNIGKVVVKVDGDDDEDVEKHTVNKLAAKL